MIDQRKLNKTILGLVPINCFYNFKEESDGKCHSTECMLNVDPLLSCAIKYEGCSIFKKHPEVIKMRTESDRPKN